MRKTIWQSAPFIFLLFLCTVVSCDLLRNSPYVVEAWTPGEGFHSDPSKLRVSLLFSHESDREKTEQAFSLLEDRKTIKGDFIWEDARLVFLPAAPLETNRDYIISLGTGAQDTKGLSLENKFEVSFSTRPAGSGPGITGIEPEYEGCFSLGREELRLCFSGQVLLNSCIDHISISPSVNGSWRLDNEGKEALFTPREPWQAGTLYRIRVDSEFCGASGAVLGNEYTSLFYGGIDRDKPVLLEVFALSSPTDTGTQGIIDETADEIIRGKIFFGKPGSVKGNEYREWESFTRLELVFSKPVDLGGLKNLLSTEPQAALIMESPPEFSDRAIFRFAEYPQWGSSFLFRLSSGVRDVSGNESGEESSFIIVAGGPLSKAPELAGIRLPMAPGNTDNEEISYTMSDIFTVLPMEIGDGRYPFSVAVPAWIELYFKTSPGSGIDIFSIMDLFRVETTNQALYFSPRSISAESFSWPNPKEGWEDYQRIEVKGLMTNTVQSGVVTFHIPAGLKDTRGNRSNYDFRISLLK